MKHLYLVRHGLSEMNVLGQRSGHTNTPLHAEGHTQAKAAGKLARDQGIVFDIVLASPLDRAHNTAKHIALEVGYDLDHILLDERLMERHYGILEGKVDTDVVSEGIRSGEHYIDQYDSVESLADMQARADEMLAYLHSLDHDTILIVTHGAIGRALHRSVNELPIHVAAVRYNNAELIKLI